MWVRFSADSSESLTIRAIVDTTGSRINSAEVISANEADSDSTPGDGTGDDFASVDFATAEADLRLTHSVDNASPFLGGNVNFTITVTNDGPNDATNVTALDLLPVGTTFFAVLRSGRLQPDDRDLEHRNPHERNKHIADDPCVGRSSRRQNQLRSDPNLRPE